MVNREIVMDYILSCLQDLVENGVEIKPDSDLVNDLGLESIKVMDLFNDAGRQIRYFHSY